MGMVIFNRVKRIKGQIVTAEAEVVEIGGGCHLEWRTVVRGTIIERESPVYATAGQAVTAFEARMVPWRELSRRTA